jgi:hypothetical protein
MTITRDKYKDVLKRLCDKASQNGTSPELYNEIYEDLDKITDALIVFSKFFDNLVKISIDETLTHNDKVNKITKLSFNNHYLTKKQAIDILERIKKSEKDAMITLKDFDMEGGGKYDILPYFKDDNNTDYTFRGVNTRYPSTTKEANSTGSRLGRIFSYYFFRLPLLYALKFIYSLGGAPFKGFKVKDFDSSVPLIYYVLFIIGLVPLPVVGSIAGIFTDIYTFIRAIDDGRIYLALITFISGILSLFILRAFDLGALFKLFYFMDVKHEVDYKNKYDSNSRRSAMADMLNITPTEAPTDIISYTINDIETNLRDKKEELEENLYNVYEEKNEVQTEIDKLDGDENYENMAEELITKMGEPVDKKSSKFKEYVKEIKRRFFGKSKGIFGFNPMGIFGKKGGATDNLGENSDLSQENILQENQGETTEKSPEETTNNSQENQQETTDKLQEETTDKLQEETTDNSQENQEGITEQINIDENILDQIVKENDDKKAELTEKLQNINTKLNDLENKIEQIENIDKNEIKRQAQELVSEVELRALRGNITDDKIDNVIDNLIKDNKKDTEKDNDNIEIDETDIDTIETDNTTEDTDNIEVDETGIDTIETDNTTENTDNIEVDETGIDTIETDDTTEDTDNMELNETKKETVETDDTTKDTNNMEVDETKKETVEEDNKVGGKRKLIYKRRKSSKKSKKKSKKKSSKKSKR